MARWLAGIAAVLLLCVGTFLALSGRAEEAELPAAPQARLASVSPGPISPIPNAPEADPKSKEEKRISLAELVEPRRKAFAKLDANSDGKLSFEEWAVRTIDKFEGADADKNQALTPAEYATTAPKPRPKKAGCACA